VNTRPAKAPKGATDIIANMIGTPFAMLKSEKVFNPGRVSKLTIRDAKATKIVAPSRAETIHRATNATPSPIFAMIADNRFTVASSTGCQGLPLILNKAISLMVPVAGVEPATY